MVSELVKSLLVELEKRVTPQNEEFITQLSILFPKDSAPYGIISEDILLTALTHNYTKFEDLFNHYRKEALLKDHLLSMHDITPVEQAILEKDAVKTKFIAASLLPYTSYI